MKIGKKINLLLGYFLLLALLQACVVVFADEQTCRADGDCSATEGAATEEEEEQEEEAPEACDNYHPQCEFWASVGESHGISWLNALNILLFEQMERPHVLLLLAMDVAL